MERWLSGRKQLTANELTRETGSLGSNPSLSVLKKERGSLKVKIIVFLVLSFLFIFSSAYADWAKKPEFRLTHLYRYDLRQDFRKLYADRISATFSYLDDEGKTLLKLMPFLETRRNIKWDIWERKSLGIEIGKDIFFWLYFGESIQKVWAREDYRNWYIPLYVKRDYMESVTRLCFTHNILSGKNFKLKGFVLNEYTFNFDRGAGVRNEVAIGFVLPLSKYIETSIDWRHIDRIHYYDSDTAEASLSLVF